MRDTTISKTCKPRASVRSLTDLKRQGACVRVHTRSVCTASKDRRAWQCCAPMYLCIPTKFPSHPPSRPSAVLRLEWQRTLHHHNEVIWCVVEPVPSAPYLCPRQRIVRSRQPFVAYTSPSRRRSQWLPAGFVTKALTCAGVHGTGVAFGGSRDGWVNASVDRCYQHRQMVTNRFVNGMPEVMRSMTD
jgi:hypothetical protein